MSIAMVVGVLVAAGFVAPARAATFFSTGSPDGKLAMASRPSDMTTEAADDFVLQNPTAIGSATFVGLLPSGAPLSSVSSVSVEIYRVFPRDSNLGRTRNVPTRTNSPSDVAFATTSPSFIAALVNPSFTAANSVDTGIHPSPNQTTGGEGGVTGEEVTFNVTFNPALMLPADHYFFVPQVGLSSGHFFWLSAPKSDATDLQAWIRNAALAPDWLRVETDIVGNTATPPTTNGTFSLSDGACSAIAVSPASLPGGVIGTPYSVRFSASGGTAPFTFTQTGALPSGMSLSPAGVLSGIPGQAAVFPITVVATDANGCQGSASPTLTVAAAPAGAGGGSSGSPSGGSGTGGSSAAGSAGGSPLVAAATVAPVMTGFNAHPTAFRAASTGGSLARAGRTGTTISYTDSEAATATFTTLRAAPGRRGKGGACGRPSGRNRRGRHCTRLAAVGSFTHPDAAGPNSFHFTGRVGRRALRPGRYQLQALATNTAGQAGQPVSTSFRIVR